jgi:hypothetical protein
MRAHPPEQSPVSHTTCEALDAGPSTTQGTPRTVTKVAAAAPVSEAVTAKFDPRTMRVALVVAAGPVPWGRPSGPTLLQSMVAWVPRRTSCTVSTTGRPKGTYIQTHIHVTRGRGG